ncbi:hypothetical protein ACFPRL_06415 [Pseudoclavibacter helvolus]
MPADDWARGIPALSTRNETSLQSSDCDSLTRLTMPLATGFRGLQSMPLPRQ